MLKGVITFLYSYEAIKVIATWHILGISQVNVKLSILLCNIILFAETDPNYSGRVAAYRKQGDLYLKSSSQVHAHKTVTESTKYL